MEKVSLDAAAIAAAQLVHAHISLQQATGQKQAPGSNEVLALYSSYLDEVRSGRHQAFTMR